LPSEAELPFDRREYNRSVLDLREKRRHERLLVLFEMAKVQAMLGKKKEAVLGLRTAVNDAAVEPGERSKKLQIAMRSYLGLLYEQNNERVLAVREYRKVLDDLDPENEAARQGIERLRRQVREEP
jgi:hypothetical protein